MKKDGMVEYRDGTKEWYQNGTRHRVDGPAIERADGSKFWFQNNKCHRTDGPALEYQNGNKFWFVNGTEITIEVYKWMAELNITYPFSPDKQILFKLRFG